MKYLNPSFTLATVSKPVTAEQWNAIFGARPPVLPKKPKSRKKGS